MSPHYPEQKRLTPSITPLAVGTHHQSIFEHINQTPKVDSY
jgi:hypothetical protein